MAGLLWGGGGLWGGATDPAEFPAYHVRLAGQGFLLVPGGGYDRHQAQQFAAKLSTSGTTENDRLGDQQLLLNDWSGGEGLTRMGTLTNTDQYRRGAGINVYDEKSVVGLGPYMAAPAALQTAFNSITALAVYQQYLVLGRADGKVYRWDGTTLSLAGDTLKTTGGITSFGVIGNNLYIGNGQDGIVWRWLGTTVPGGANFAANFTVGGFNGGTVNGVYGLLGDVRTSFLGTGWYGADSSNAGLVGQIANTAGTTNPGPGAGFDTNTLVSPDAGIRVLLPLGGGLLAVGVNQTARYSRLYTSSDANPIVWTLRAVISDATITCGTIMAGSYYFGDAIQGRIWKWDGSKLTIYRQLGSDLAPYTSSITGIATWREALWVAIKDVDGSCALLRDDGAGNWSRPVTGLTGTTQGPVAVWQDQLHYATQATGAAKVFRTDGTYAASGYVESPLQNANLGGTGKLWQGVTVNHSALVSGQSVAVQYQLNDSGSWVTLGTSSTAGATSADFNFPSAVEADQVGFKLILTGVAAGSTSPLRVFSLAARYLPSPDALWGWTLQLDLHGTTALPMSRADGTAEPLTGDDLSAYIRGLVEDGLPVSFVDITDDEYTVMIDDYSEQLAPRSIQLAASSNGWEREGRIQLRQKADS